MRAVGHEDSEGPEARVAPVEPREKLPRDVDIDRDDLRDRETERRREFLEASWEEILGCMNGASAGIAEEKLEEILGAATNIPLEKRGLVGGVNDLLFTLRNLLSDDAEIRGLGEIRIACHTRLQEVEEVENEPLKRYLRSMTLVAFDHFQEAYENYLFGGIFSNMKDDYPVRELVEEFVHTDGAAVSPDREDAAYVQAVYSAIRAMGYVGIQPETLLKTKPVTIDVRTDISGVSDEHLLQKIQRAPMLSRDGTDRVFGKDRDHDVLEIVLYSEHRPVSLPTFTDVFAAVEQSGRLTDRAKEAKTLVELMRLSRGRLCFSSARSQDRYWRYAYQVSDAIDAPWKEEIIGWRTDDDDDE